MAAQPLGAQYSLIDEDDAHILDGILEHVYSAYVEQITLFKDPSGEVVAWLLEGTNHRDIYTQAWLRDFTLKLDKWSKPGTKEYGHTTAKSQVLVDAFEVLVAELECDREVFEWIPMTNLAA